MPQSGLDQPVLVVGAGVCGLAIAHGLKNAKVPFLVFDAGDDGSSLCSEDWSARLKDGMPLLRKLVSKDLADRLDTLLVAGGTLSSDDFPSDTAGAPGSGIDELSGEAAMDVGPSKISGAKLRALCNEGLHVEVRYVVQHVQRKI